MGLFNEFAKVETRKEIPSLKSDLEKVLDIEREIITQYKNDERIKDVNTLQNELYLSILNDTQEKIKNTTYTSQTLQEYIDTRENQFSDEGKIRGMYSGALLEILCKRSQDPISIDGRGREWHYLFFHAKHIQNLSVQKFYGSNILAHIGSYKGSVQNVSVKKIKGSGTLSHAGSVSGSVKDLHCKYMQGDDLLYSAGREKGTLSNITLTFVKGDDILLGGASYEGKMHNLYVENITGKHNLKSMGLQKGVIENVTVLNNKGYLLLSRLGESGSAKNIRVINSEGNFLLSQECQDDTNGILENVFIADSISDFLLQKVGCKKNIARNIVLSNVKGARILSNSANKGTLENVVVTDSNSSKMLAESSTSIHSVAMPREESILQKIIIANGETELLLKNSGTKTIPDCTIGKAVTDVITYNVTGFGIFDSATIENHTPAETFSEQKKEIFDAILLLVKEMKNMPVTKQEKAHEQIARLQKEIFSEET